MAWPTTGVVPGWEPFGTLVETLPELYPLPSRAFGYYYDPAKLGGIGLAQPAVVVLFHGSTIVARQRTSTVEAEFMALNVWGDALLDQLVVLEVGAPCALVLDVYDDDRSTILWSVGTASSHAQPYLVEPDTYAEQEIDVATGSATVGTVTVTVVDVPVTPGDQDSGWLTERLSALGLSNIRGRRARLRRFVSEALGFYVIADGPAGTPRLDSSYSAFTFDIRDTRETERKLTLFTAGGEQSLIPEGTLEGYGYDVLQDWLIDPAAPMEGTYTASTGFVSVTGPGGITQVPMSNAAAQATVALNADFSGPDDPLTWINRTPMWFRWRAQGSSDPWTEIRETLAAVVFTIDPIVLFDFSSGFLPDDGVHNVIGIFIGSHPDGAGLPADGQAIDWQFIGPRGVPPTSQIPFSVDGLTAGEFVQRVYDGFYSERGVNGELVPSGIQYDAAALALMTTPVRIRVVAAIDDARDWLEKHIFAPTGWVPALDDLGRVSPISQVAPTSVFGLPTLSDTIAEASPDWNAGERIINVLRVTYLRDYRPVLVADAETGDGLADREVVLEYVDPVSVERNGEQILAFRYEAFRAIGDPDAEPVSGDYADELAWQLSQLRQLHVQARYSLGAPAVSVAVMREATLGLRAGSWVIIDLSWLPDYVTQRRGLVTLAQVIALGDLDCKWRRALMEVVVPLVEPGS